MRTLITILAILTGLAGAAPALACQDPAEARRGLERHQQDVARATAVFLDRTRPPAERLEAVASVEAILDPRQVEAAIALVRDAAEPPDVRAAGLRRVHHVLLQRTDLAREVLGWLRAADAPRALRDASLESARVLSFSGPGVHELREELFSAFRAITRDEQPSYRETALSILWTYGDDGAQRLLIAGLRDPGQQLLPPEKAVAILGLNLHGDYLPTLHELLKRPPSPATQVECARLLGTYAPARPDLIRQLQDREAAEALRLAAAGALAAGDPAGFSAAALPVVRDATAPESLRVYSIQAEMRRRASKEVRALLREPDEFDRFVRSLAQEERAEAVRAAAVRYADEVQP